MLNVTASEEGDLHKTCGAWQLLWDTRWNFNTSGHLSSHVEARPKVNIYVGIWYATEYIDNSL